MQEPSASPPAAESDRFARLIELVESYRTEHAILLAHQSEVERRRAAVRAAAEQEASEILLSARREIRRVLLRTRHDLVMLAAQLRAAGCGPGPGQSVAGDDSEASMARDVRDLLREARSELSQLSGSTAELSPADGDERRTLAPLTAPMASRPDPDLAHDFSSAPTHVQSDGAADDSSEQVPPPMRPTGPFVAHWRAAAVALVGLAAVATVIVAVRPSPRSEAPGSTSPPASGRPTIEAAAPAPNASTERIAASEKAGSGILSLTLEVRRPAWLRITADGEADLGRTYQEGERRSIQATREILLRAGDAGAVFVSVGGAALVPLGPDGQVRTRRFVPEGAPAVGQAGEVSTTPQVSELPPASAHAVASAAVAGTGSDVPSAATVPERTAAGTHANGQPDRAAVTSGYAAVAEREILERHQQWFDAFQRGDQARMASLATDTFSLVDQRPERAPAASVRVEQTIHDVRVHVADGVGAVLSGRITEATVIDGTPAATVSMLSEVWIRRGDEWRLISVRIVPLSAVSTTLQ